MIRARISPLASGRSGVEPRTAHYLARVLRLAVGDRFIAFCDTTHREAVAEVVSVAGAAVDIDIAEITPAKVVATVPVMVVQGLAKGDKFVAEGYTHHYDRTGDTGQTVRAGWSSRR